MKNKLYIILALLGLAGFAYGTTKMWSGVHLKLADKIMGSMGYELFAGQVAIALAIVAAVILFIRPKLVAIPGLLIIACTVFVYFLPKTDKHSAQSGLFISAGAAVLIVIASLIVPMRHPRR